MEDILVKARGQTFSGRIVARRRFRYYVRFRQINPTGERYGWFWKWQIVQPDE